MPGSTAQGKENIWAEAASSSTPSRTKTALLLSGPQRVLVPTKTPAKTIPRASTLMSTTEAYRNGCYPTPRKDDDVHNSSNVAATNTSGFGASTPQRKQAAARPLSQQQQHSSPLGTQKRTATKESPTTFASPGQLSHRVSTSATSGGLSSKTKQAAPCRGPLPGALSDTINSDRSSNNSGEVKAFPVSAPAPAIPRGHVPSFQPPPPPTPPPALSNRKSQTPVQTQIAAHSAATATQSHTLSSGSRNSAAAALRKTQTGGKAGGGLQQHRGSAFISKISGAGSIISRGGSTITGNVFRGPRAAAFSSSSSSASCSAKPPPQYRQQNAVPSAILSAVRQSCSFGSELSSVVNEGSIGGLELELGLGLGLGLAFGEDELVTGSVSFDCDHSLSLSVSTQVSGGGGGGAGHRQGALVSHLTNKLAAGAVGGGRQSRVASQTQRQPRHVFTDLDAPAATAAVSRSPSAHAVPALLQSSSPLQINARPSSLGLTGSGLGNCSLSAVGLDTYLTSPRSVDGASWTSASASLQRLSSTSSGRSHLGLGQSVGALHAASASAEINQAFIASIQSAQGSERDSLASASSTLLTSPTSSPRISPTPRASSPCDSGSVASGGVRSTSASPLDRALLHDSTSAASVSVSSVSGTISQHVGSTFHTLQTLPSFNTASSLGIALGVYAVSSSSGGVGSPGYSESTDYIDSSLSLTQVYQSRDGRDNDSMGIMLDFASAGASGIGGEDGTQAVAGDEPKEDVGVCKNRGEEGANNY